MWVEYATELECPLSAPAGSFYLQSCLFVEGRYFLGNSSTKGITKIQSRDKMGAGAF